jgi:hypothetical protein
MVRVTLKQLVNELFVSGEASDSNRRLGTTLDRGEHFNSGAIQSIETSCSLSTGLTSSELLGMSALLLQFTLEAFYDFLEPSDLFHRLLVGCVWRIDPRRRFLVPLGFFRLPAVKCREHQYSSSSSSSQVRFGFL